MLQEALNHLLKEHTTLKLATVDAQRLPWVATAYFATDDPFTLTVLIEAGGRTLANIRDNPNVAIMVEQGDPLTLFAQADATARLVDERHEEIRQAITDKVPNSAPLVALPRLIAVRLDVQSWRLTHVPAGWLPARELVRPGTRPQLGSGAPAGSARA